MFETIIINKNIEKLITNKQTLFLPIGIPASGKSYFCNSIKEELNKINKDITLISTDILREKFFSNVLEQKNNKEVFEIFYKEIESSLSQGKNVYADLTNLEEKTRNSFFEIIERKNLDVEIKEVFFINYPFFSDIIQKTFRKEKIVDIEVIEDMFLRYDFNGVFNNSTGLSNEYILKENDLFGIQGIINYLYMNDFEKNEEKNIQTILNSELLNRNFYILFPANFNESINNQVSIKVEKDINAIKNYFDSNINDKKESVKFKKFLQVESILSPYLKLYFFFKDKEKILKDSFNEVFIKIDEYKQEYINNNMNNDFFYSKTIYKVLGSLFLLLKNKVRLNPKNGDVQILKNQNFYTQYILLSCFYYHFYFKNNLNSFII